MRRPDAEHLLIGQHQRAIQLPQLLRRGRTSLMVLEQISCAAGQPRGLAAPRRHALQIQMCRLISRSPESRLASDMATISERPWFPSFSAAFAAFSKPVARLSSRATAEGRSFLGRSRYSLIRRLVSSTSSVRVSSDGACSIVAGLARATSKAFRPTFCSSFSRLSYGRARADRVYRAVRNAPRPSRKGVRQR